MEQAKMTTINLYQDQQKEQKNKVFGGGFFISVGVITFTILVLVGLKFAVSILNKQSEKLAASVQNEKNSLTNLSDIKKVVDVQTRLNQIKDNLQIKDNGVSRTQMTQVLDNMGTEINTGIVVSSYKYENNENENRISLDFNAFNFSDAAKQIISFKNSNYFTNFSLVKISKSGSVISCSVEMNIKS